MVEFIVTKERDESFVLAKIVTAVRIQRSFREICFHPPENVEELKAPLRGVASEADNSALVLTSSYAFEPVGCISDNEDTYAMCADRRNLNTAQVKRVPGYRTSYGAISKSHYLGQDGRATPSKN